MASAVIDLPATSCLLRERTESCRQFERTRNLVERSLFRFAYAHAADAEKSAFLGGLGNVLADLAEPPLEGRCIAGRLGIDYRTSLPQRLDALGFDLGGLAACELYLQAAAGGEKMLKLATGTLRDGPGRRLADHRAVRRTL